MREASQDGGARGGSGRHHEARRRRDHERGEHAAPARRRRGWRDPARRRSGAGARVEGAGADRAGRGGRDDRRRHAPRAGSSTRPRWSSEGPRRRRSIERATRSTCGWPSRLGCKSLALVAFGTGVGGFPLDEAARIMVGVAALARGRARAHHLRGPRRGRRARVPGGRRGNVSGAPGPRGARQVQGHLQRRRGRRRRSPPACAQPGATSRSCRSPTAAREPPRRSAARPCRRHASDALGRPVEASFSWLDDGETAVVEAAAASGLWRLAPDELDPLDGDVGRDRRADRGRDRRGRAARDRRVRRNRDRGRRRRGCSTRSARRRAASASPRCATCARRGSGRPRTSGRRRAPAADAVKRLQRAARPRARARCERTRAACR